MTATATVKNAPGEQVFTTNLPAQVADRGISSADVSDLIEAAGPLTVAHIAGGLNVSVREAWSCVREMLARNWLREDEFERYRLAGAYAAI
jgi:hypothetical protein